ncbi:MAG: GTP 3',8-cyclase MoaA [Methylococcales bacterium]|nr:GTP 3',8-cyclase MoaA [Methylococcales bacterium]
MNTSDSHTLMDRFGRKVDYLRISITDRCDFRCQYCMAEEMTFLPRAQVLTLEEIYTISCAFMELGVKKIRVTGGEPLIRKGVLPLLNKIGQHKSLDELVLTTNGSHLKSMAKDLYNAKVKRINVSLDTLNPLKFKAITRTGNLQTVLEGIEAITKHDFARIKINAVILKNKNHTEVNDLVQFAVNNGIDISFIEEMPLGIIQGESRAERYYSSDDIKADIEQRFSLTASLETTGGPSHYFNVNQTQTRVGFISPHSANFCSTCNRVRLTVEGQLLLCLGQEHSVDLKHIIRANPGDMNYLKQIIIESMKIKPERHEFTLKEQPVVLRYMNTTGG